MRGHRAIAMLSVALMTEALLLPWAKAALAVERPRLWVVVNARNPADHLAVAELRAIYTANQRFWPRMGPVVPINGLPRSQVRLAFDRIVLDMGPDEAGRFWIDQQVRGGAPPPRKAPSARLAAAMVRKLRGGIAYLEAGTCVPRGTKLVAIIEGGAVRRPPSQEHPSCLR
ncbi:MAG: hypothetical protein AAFU79_01405 [Myxococcota bacterium]